MSTWINFLIKSTFNGTMDIQDEKSLNREALIQTHKTSIGIRP
jgi:hypothetical protein